MDDLRAQQVEALEVAQEYVNKLIPGMESMVNELKGQRKDDTDEYLKFLINGLNWVIEVYNGTMSLINEKEKRIDKDVVNKDVQTLNAALTKKDDLQIAAMLEIGILPFLRDFLKAAREIVA